MLSLSVLIAVLAVPLHTVYIQSCFHRLADKFKSEDQSPPVPVLVVTRETGRQLLRLVEQNPREVYMKVDRLSLQDVVERGGEKDAGFSWLQLVLYPVAPPTRGEGTSDSF